MKAVEFNFVNMLITGNMKLTCSELCEIMLTSARISGGFEAICGYSGELTMDYQSGKFNSKSFPKSKDTEKRHSVLSPHPLPRANTSQKSPGLIELKYFLKPCHNIGVISPTRYQIIKRDHFYIDKKWKFLPEYIFVNSSVKYKIQGIRTNISNSKVLYFLHFFLCWFVYLSIILSSIYCKENFQCKQIKRTNC